HQTRPSHHRQPDQLTRHHPQAHPDSCQGIGSDSQTGRLIDALCLISEACCASCYQGRSRFPSFPLGLDFLACLSFSAVSPASVSAWRNNPTSWSDSIYGSCLTRLELRRSYFRILQNCSLLSSFGITPR